MFSASRFEVILCESDVCFGCVVVFTSDGDSSKRCNLCLKEKLLIICRPERSADD